jgi:hypothetical protein
VRRSARGRRSLARSGDPRRARGQRIRLYAERPLALPHTWLCYRPDAAAPPVSPVATSPVTFGSFNGVYKLGTRVLDTWCRLLQAVPESRLLACYTLHVDARPECHYHGGHVKNAVHNI